VTVRLFVYGTLLAGERWHDSCLAGRFVSCEAAWTRGVLYALEEGFPALCDGEGRVWGEAYAFDPEAWERVRPALDALEGYRGPGRSDNEYERVRRAVWEARTGRRRTAYLYRHPAPAPPPGALLIVGGDWRLWRRR